MERNVKIADFGLSNYSRDGFFLQTACGSPNYAAPEVIKGSPYVGMEADIWSCGVILYSLLCGFLPFHDTNLPTLFEKIFSGSYHFPAHLSMLSKDLIRQMLVVDPVKRITLSDIKKHPWYSGKSLPPYLLLSPSQIELQYAKVDEEIVTQIKHLFLPIIVSDEDVLSALRCEHELDDRRHSLLSNNSYSDGSIPQNYDTACGRFDIPRRNHPDEMSTARDRDLVVPTRDQCHSSLGMMSKMRVCYYLLLDDKLRQLRSASAASLSSLPGNVRQKRNNYEVHGSYQMKVDPEHAPGAVKAFSRSDFDRLVADTVSSASLYSPTGSGWGGERRRSVARARP